jgi:pyruvate dehydrogenase E1 component
MVIAISSPQRFRYDPTYSYEVAVIVQDGLRRMYGENEDVFYYITTLNENYSHVDMPDGAEDGIRKGMYKLRSVEAKKKAARVHLLGSGSILREVECGAALLADDFGVASDIWSVTSFMELRRDGLATDRWNMLHPTAAPKRSYVETCLEKADGPVIAATDYMKLLADQIRPFVPGRYRVLGTDGFGRSD